MTNVRSKGEQVRRYIVEHVAQHPKDIAKLTGEKFDISRQAVNKHLQNLIGERALLAEGNTRGRIYKLCPLAQWDKTYPLQPTLAEDVIWRQDVVASLGQLPGNVLAIWH